MPMIFETFSIISVARIYQRCLKWAWDKNCMVGSGSDCCLGCISCCHHLQQLVSFFPVENQSQHSVNSVQSWNQTVLCSVLQTSDKKRKCLINWSVLDEDYDKDMKLHQKRQLTVLQCYFSFVMCEGQCISNEFGQIIAEKERRKVSNLPMVF